MSLAKFGELAFGIKAKLAAAAAECRVQFGELAFGIKAKLILGGAVGALEFGELAFGIKAKRLVAIMHRMKKFDSGLLKVAILAWGVPAAIVAAAWWATPDPNRPKASFTSVTFVPSDIKVISHKERKNADYFELWLVHPDGSAYFHRDPEPEPVHRLADAIPRGEPLRVVYETDSAGNAVMEIAQANPSGKTYLAFEEVTAEYASRRRLVVIIAGIWFVLGNAVLVLLWRTKI